jgi:hypothetical protein
LPELNKKKGNALIVDEAGRTWAWAELAGLGHGQSERERERVAGQLKVTRVHATTSASHWWVTQLV